MKKYNFNMIMGILCLGLIGMITISVLIGSANLQPLDVWKIIVNRGVGKNIFTPTWSRNIEIIVWNLRFPRVLMAVVAGASLSLVGILMQVLTKNSLADPYILGISSGSSTGAVLMIILGGGGFLSVPLGAFILGSITAAFVFYSGENGGYSNSKLVLTGVAVSSLLSGITTFLVMTAPNENQVRSAMFWMAGSLAGSNWKVFQVAGAALLFSYLIIRVYYREFNMMLTGDDTAEILGVNVKRVRGTIVVISTLLTGFVVANTGIIGFVGLVVPHIGRGIIGSDHKKLIKFSLIFGGAFLLFTDILARSILKGQEIPIGVITAVMGAPFFMWLIKRSGYRFGGE